MSDLGIGTRIFIKHDSEVWARAEIVSIKEHAITVKLHLTDELRDISSNHPIYIQNTEEYDEEGLVTLDDLTFLSHLHDASVLSSLHDRFDLDKIYTNTGSVLIAINPFKMIPHLYDSERIQSYLKTIDWSSVPAVAALASTTQGTNPAPPPPTEHSPHVYNVAYDAYCRLWQEKKNQTILISGESGAGKTETTKFILNFLSHFSNGEVLTDNVQLAEKNQTKETRQKDLFMRNEISRKILESNPLLESFGNAATVRNKNSSRFGKFIELDFHSSTKKLVSGSVKTYLLEKVRITNQQEGERNFHIFYQICEAYKRIDSNGRYYPTHIFDSSAYNPNGAESPSGADKSVDLSFLNDIYYFKYLTKSSCYILDDMDDLYNFDATLHAMRTLNITNQEISNILRVLGAILYVGNITYDVDTNNSEGVVLSSTVVEDVDRVCELLSVEKSALMECLMFRRIVTHQETFKKCLTLSQAESARDALARSLYHNLFCYITLLINRAINNTVLPQTPVEEPKSGDHWGEEGKKEEKRGDRKEEKDFGKVSIGILDIFGFESFTVNNFEQLCINYTNERLQNIFNFYIFDCEENLYKQEKIKWRKNDYPSNNRNIKIFDDKPYGIFSLLDEECIIPQGNDKSFMSKILYHNSSSAPNPALGGKQNSQGKVSTPTAAGTNIAAKEEGSIIWKLRNDYVNIQHFAGVVSYNVENFVEKNKDLLLQDVELCVQQSANQFVAELLQMKSLLSTTNQSELPFSFSTILQGNKENAIQTGGATGKSKKLTTVSFEFRNQLNFLMENIRKTRPHFIRCIKPNNQNLPDIFDRISVNEQLKYSGVLHIINISRQGYPVRMSIADAYGEMRTLIPSKKTFGRELSTSTSSKDELKGLLCEMFSTLQKKFFGEGLPDIYEEMKKAEKRGDVKEIEGGETVETDQIYLWQVGETLCFLRLNFYEKLLNSILKVKNDNALIIQKNWKRFIERKKYQEYRRKVILCQSVARRFLVLLKTQRLRRVAAAITIQKNLRGHFARKKYNRDKKNLSQLQSALATVYQKHVYHEKRLQLCAIRIQNAWRGYQERKKIGNKREKCILIQRQWRKYLMNKKLMAIKTQENILVSKIQEQFDEIQELKRLFSEETTRRVKDEKELLIRHEKIVQLEMRVDELERVNIADTMKYEAVIQDLENSSKSWQDKYMKLKAELADVQEAYQSYRDQFTDDKKVEEKRSERERIKRISGVASKSNDVCIVTLGDIEKLVATMHAYLTKVHDTVSASRLKTEASSALSTHAENTILPYKIPLSPSTSPSITILLHLLTNISAMSHNVRTMDPASQGAHAYSRNALLEIMHRSAHCLIVIDFSTELPCSSDEARQWLSDMHDLCEKSETSFFIWNPSSFSPSDCVPSSLLSSDRLLSHDLKSFEQVLPFILHSSASMANNSVPSPQQPHVAPHTSSNLILSTLHKWFTSPSPSHGPTQPHHQNKSAGPPVGFLRPSIPRTSVESPSPQSPVTMDSVIPVQEILEKTSAITCVCFAQEKSHVWYYLLACAMKDGGMIIYRIYRTPYEVSLIGEEEIKRLRVENKGNVFDKPPKTEKQFINVHSRLSGHTRAITSIFFSLLEDHIVSTSIDKSVRIWNVDTGEMIKVFTDSSPSLVGAFLPFNPSVFLACNANSIVRLVNTQNGEVTQKIKVDSEVRALKFDDTGLYCMAGTKSGHIHIMEAANNNSFRFKFKSQIARQAITSIVFVSSKNYYPSLFVNTCDNSIVVVDCIYGPQPGVLSALRVRSRLKIEQAALPIRSVYSSYGGGYLISGSEDKGIYVFNVGGGDNSNFEGSLDDTSGHCTTLQHHEAPVLTSACNSTDTLLITADGSGHIVFWRRTM